VEQSNIRNHWWNTSVDEKSNLLVITAEMPGISKEDIEVNVTNNPIVLHGEKAIRNTIQRFQLKQN